jgi:hypothetical protein
VNRAALKTEVNVLTTCGMSGSHSGNSLLGYNAV